MVDEELQTTEPIPLDEYGRRHGLYTKEWMAFIEKGEQMPIMKEIMRRPDLRDTYNVVLELLMADEEVDLPPLTMLRAVLNTMRELKLITYELQNFEILPDSHPKLANAIQRAVNQVDQLQREHRKSKVDVGLYEMLQQNITRLKIIDIEFEEAPVDAHIDVVEGAFKVIDDDEEDEEDDA